ncbi:glycosyl hydrolase [Aspergillus floccosus]
MLRSSLSLAALITIPAMPSLSLAARSPETAAEGCHGISGPFLDPSFPDPSLYHINDTWYSFGTSNGKDFQGAESTEFDSGWSKLDSPILAIDEVTWAGRQQDGTYGLWAPDVFQRSSDNKFVMYFSALDKETIGADPVQHCIGAAVSDDIAGVYHSVNDFVQCNRTASGVIDPAWFKDADGRQYVVYKTEIPKNNQVPPNWLEIREVRSSGPKEGVEWVGNAQKLLKMNSQGFDDGNNIEAPYLFRRGDTYFLTYSTHFTGDGSYDVQYATAKKATGPYTRVKEPLLKTTDVFGCRLSGPGGASFQRDAQGDQETVRMIFHGLTDEMDINKRVVYTATVEVDGERLRIKSA